METIHDIVFFPGKEKRLSTFENDLAQEQKQTQECVKIALKILGSFKFFCFILFNPCKYVHYATANVYLTHEEDTIIIIDHNVKSFSIHKINCQCCLNRLSIQYSPPTSKCVTVNLKDI